MATASKAKTGFSVPCPHCGCMADEDGDGGLVVSVATLAVTCPNCDETVTRADLERMAAEALRLARWLEAASV